MGQLEFDKKIYDTIRRNIKKYRKLRKLTSAELAEMVDLSHDFIRQIQSEKAGYNFSVDTFYKISVALGVSMDELIEKPTESKGITKNKLLYSQRADTQRKALIMTFSAFAKVLYPYCSKGLKQADFVVLLIDKFMEGQPGRAHSDSGYQNPLRNKDDRTLLSYFNGDRKISKADASIILSHTSKYKFEMYLRTGLSEDALKLLKSRLSQQISINDFEDVVEICADQFVAIIEGLAANK